MRLQDFAGFRESRDVARTPCLGRLAFPPLEVDASEPVPGSLSAADRVRERLQALKSGAGQKADRRVPGIAGVPKWGAVEDVKPKTKLARSVESLIFRCSGPLCRHTWVSGRGATSFEQICKSCGASVVGVVSEGELCEVRDGPSGEVLHVRWPVSSVPPDLELALKRFVQAELCFVSRFFTEGGLVDYIAHRRQGVVDEVGKPMRNMQKDVQLVACMADTLEALCKAEFQGTMRGGEADAKLQGLLNGEVEFRFLTAPARSAGGTMLTVEVDFSTALDIEDRIADRVDECVHALRRVMREMDKVETQKPHIMQHPRTLLGQLISGLDWHRAVSAGREGHDRVRCMTCRFLGDDCSLDVVRSQQVRGALRQVPGFVFQAHVVLGREDHGGKSWEERSANFLEGVAQTKGGECFILASSDARHLHLKLFSHPEWLSNAVDRTVTYAQAASKNNTLLSNLVGLGRVAKGLHVVEPAIGARPAFHVVHDVLSFMELFASKDPDTEMPRVRWQGISPHSFLVNAQQYETTKTLFRTHACFQDLRDFVDFLQDFRRGGPAAARAKPEPRPPPAARGPSELSRRSRQLITSVSCQRMQSLRRSPSVRRPSSADSRTSTSRSRERGVRHQPQKRKRARSRTPSPRQSPSVHRSRKPNRKQASSQRTTTRYLQR